VNNNPAGVGVVISAAVKAVLIAVAALGWVPLDEDAIASVTLAVAAVVDVLLYLGLVKPRVNELQAQANANQGTPPGVTQSPGQPDTAHRNGVTFRGPDIR
jgi:hypothetical protein